MVQLRTMQNVARIRKHFFSTEQKKGFMPKLAADPLHPPLPYQLCHVGMYAPPRPGKNKGPWSPQTRKFSRLNAMRNQNHYVLIRIDPIISFFRFVKHKTTNSNPFPEDVENLLKLLINVIVNK